MDQATTHASEHRQRQGNANDPEYEGFLARLQARYLTNTLNGKLPLFTTDAPELFEAYLAAFPEETRGYHKCHACRRFVERFGGLVTIDEAGVTTPAIWHEYDAPEHYKPAVSALARLVRRAKVTGVFLAGPSLGTWGEPVTGIWHHMAVTPAREHVYLRVVPTAGQAMAEKREDRGNVLRALAEYRIEHVEQAVTLLKSEALYRAEKVLAPAEWLLALHKARAAAKGKEQRENVVWLAVAKAPAGFCHPRSSMIGTLLDELQAGVSFETARRNFASKMHPLSYQRPQAAPSAGNIAQAEKLFAELGLAPALRRRFARLEDVVHAAIWLPKLEEPKASGGGLFSHLVPKERPGVTMARVPPAGGTTWEKFARTVLPEDVLEKAAAAFEEGAADARRHDAPTLSGHLRARAERFVQLAVLFAVLLLIGCAADHDLPRGDGPPLYVHLCDGMPAADQLAWGDAAGVINASLALALEEPALWVGHGMPVGCDTVYVCPSSAVRADVELRRSPCTTTVRYAPDAAQQVAAATYEALLEEWPPAAAWHVEIGEAVLRGGT